MTYCVGLRLNKGLVLMSDTRTNSGIDNISVFRKMFSWDLPGDRVITVMTAGNLATTQSVISLLNERCKIPEERNPSILEAPTLFQVAGIVSKTLLEVIQERINVGQNAGMFGATLIVAGQIKGTDPQLFMIYPEGNFIEATDDTPFFQIGETKYGKPILVRAYDPDMSFEEAIKLLVLSFDATLKANLSVGFPLDLQVIARDELKVHTEDRLDAQHPYISAVSEGWKDALRKAFQTLPKFEL